MHLDPKIRVNLLQMANDFYEKTELPSPVIDIYLMGSGANYNWTPDSDIDVHVITDYSKLQMPPETATQTVKTAGAQWNAEHNVLIKGHKVEMNLQNAAEQKPYVTGIYSLTADQWLRKPLKTPFNLNRQVLKFHYETMKNYVSATIGSCDREKMKAAKKYLDAYRQYGLDTFGELSYENIIYKMLRSRGLIKQLKDSIVSVYDQQMTVDEVGEKDINQSQPALSASDHETIGNPKFDRSYWDKNNREGTYNISRLTLDELKALREKARRMMSGKGEWAAIHSADFKLYDDEIKRRLQYINAPVTEKKKLATDPHRDELELGHQTPKFDPGSLSHDIDRIRETNQNEFDMGQKHQTWNLLPARDVVLLWATFAKYGRVDDKKILKLFGMLSDLVIKLCLNTDVWQGNDPIFFGKDSFDEITDEENEMFAWFISDLSKNNWIRNTGERGGNARYSDQSDRLYKLLEKCYNSETPEELLVNMDLILNFVHGMGHMAKWFVEGGTNTLDKIRDFQVKGIHLAGKLAEDHVNEGFGAGIPEDDRLKIKNTDGSTRRWQIRSKDSPKTPKIPTEDIQRMGTSTSHAPTSARTNLFPTPVETEIEPRVQKIISTAEKVLDKRSATHPFFEIEYVEDLVGDIVAIDLPSAPSDKVKHIVSVIVQWIARDYDIRKNGTRIGE
jgi:hypothetical protein